MCTYLTVWLWIDRKVKQGRGNSKSKSNGDGKHAAAPYQLIVCITFIPLNPFCWTTYRASNYMHRGPHA